MAPLRSRRRTQIHCRIDCAASSSRFQPRLGCGLLHVALLPQLGVHQEAEPESLQHPEDQALGSIQKSETKEVAVYEQRKRPDEKRHAVVSFAQEPLSFDRIAISVRLNSPRTLFRAQLSHFCVGPSIVPRSPFTQR